jgi:hypothetical protein
MIATDVYVCVSSSVPQGRLNLARDDGPESRQHTEKSRRDD